LALVQFCCACSSDYLLNYTASDFYLFFFFFQAEDGIRDRNVTGVQTCALPISELHNTSETRADSNSLILNYLLYPLVQSESALRSEERRVGKEWRSRWRKYY